jgi:hypothetical protein
MRTMKSVLILLCFVAIMAMITCHKDRPHRNDKNNHKDRHANDNKKKNEWLRDDYWNDDGNTEEDEDDKPITRRSNRNDNNHDDPDYETYDMYVFAIQWDSKRLIYSRHLLS